MSDETAQGNGTDPAVSNGAEYARRLEPLDEALEHVLLQLADSDFILTGPNGGVTRWGDRAKLLFGWETQRIVGSSLFETVLSGGDDEGPVRRWESYLADREGKPPPARFTVGARHCDGAEFPLELTFVPVRLSQGSEFSFFVRDLTAELTQGAKLARLRREHKEVLESISSALSEGTSLEPGERLAGVLVAYAAVGPTPWVDAARREAEEAAAALADVSEAGEKGGESAAADRMARTLAKAKRAERHAEEANAERQALQEQLTTAVERSEQLEREGAAMREALDDARKQASAADEHAERAQNEAESAHSDADQAIRLVRDLERQTQEVRGQLTQARGDSGEGAKRLAELERATEGATDRLAQLEKALAEARSQPADPAPPGEDPVAREEARRLGERVEEALEQLAEARKQLSDAPTQSSDPVDTAPVRDEVQAAVEQLQQLRTESEEEVREAARGAGGEAKRAREELAAAREELAATQAEVADTKAELTGLRELVGIVREAAESAGEQARFADQRSQDVSGRLAEIAGYVERAGAEHASERKEFATLKAQAEEVLALLERSVGSALSGAPAAYDWSEPAAAPVEREPEPDPEPTREPREGFDEVEAPMAVLDLEGRFRALNPHFCELVGYSEEEFRTAIWPSSLSDDATRKEHRELRGRLATGEIEESPLETCYLHKEGLLVPVSGTVSLVRGDDGEPDHLLLSGAADRAALSA